MTNVPLSQRIHDKLLLLQLVNYYRREYTDIKVNHKDFQRDRPAPVGGYIPDMTAMKNNQMVICGIMASDSGNDDNIVQQWRVFSRSGYKFHVIVTKNLFQNAKELAKANGINVDKYWCC